MASWSVNFDTRVNADDPKVVGLIARCYALAPVINGIPITPSRRDKIDRLNILRAIRGTTGIEGAQLTVDEVALIIDSPLGKSALPKNRSQEEQEGKNAQSVMKWIVRLIRRNPRCQLTEKIIRHAHKMLTRKIEYQGNVPGEYRSFPLAVGGYIPPRDSEVVRQLMENFISWFNEGLPSKWDPIIRAIVAHFYIVSIHPFADGNGRTSRAVESLLLYQAGINARGFYSLANFYYQHRVEYVSFLDDVRFRTNGDLTPFVLFALNGLVSELESVHQEVLLEVREIAFRDYVREQLQDKLDTKSGLRMLDFMVLLGITPTSIKEIRSGGHPLHKIYNKLTPRTLYRDLEYLKGLKLITLEKEGCLKANLDVMGQFTAHKELMG